MSSTYAPEFFLGSIDNQHAENDTATARYRSKQMLQPCSRNGDAKIGAEHGHLATLRYRRISSTESSLSIAKSPLISASDTFTAAAKTVEGGRGDAGMRGHGGRTHAGSPRGHGLAIRRTVVSAAPHHLQGVPGKTP